MTREEAVSIIEDDYTIIKKMAHIKKTEETLFRLIELEQTTYDNYERNYLNKRISNLQTSYSISQVW